MSKKENLPYNLLCVDDDPDFIAYFIAATEPYNIAVDTSYHAQDALNKIQTVPYDFLVIDLHLQGGSGFELIEKIRNEGIETPIAVVTGVYRDEESFRLLKERFQIEFVLDKPIYPQQIDALLTHFTLEMIHVFSEQEEKFHLLKETYEKSIGKKYATLHQLVREVQHNPEEQHLLALKEYAHKIAGSAGSYGFPDVTSLCQQLEHQIEAQHTFDEEWLFSLDSFLRDIKYHFQLPEKDTFILESHSFRNSLFVIDEEKQFLELLEKEKDNFSYEVFCESDPQVAIRRLKEPDFNPRVVISTNKFSGTSRTGYDLFSALKSKPHYLSTLFGLIIDDGIDERLEAAEKGIKYLYHRPVSAHLLLHSVSHVLEAEHLRKIKVLVLDNEPEVCQFVTESLGEIGMNVNSLHDPKQLYSTLQDYMPHVLIMDVFLPDYNGFDLLKTLRADFNYNNLMIIIISVKVDDTTRQRAYAEHADGILHKPLDKSMLQSRVHHLINRHVMFDTLFNRKWIGLDRTNHLIDALHEVLTRPKFSRHDLVVFEINQFSRFPFSDHKTTKYQLLILISNLLQKINNFAKSCYHLNEGKFAILYGGYELQDLEKEVTELLLDIKREIKFDISFHCGIVPISSHYKNAYDILSAAEESIIESKELEPSTIQMSVHLSKNEKTEKKEIMLIDPDKELMELLKKSYELHNFIVTTFTTGEDALENLLSRQEKQLPSLIIAERMLPDMDGFTLLSTLKTRFHRQPPFYFLTVYGSDKDVSNGLALGAIDYIVKPFNLPLLMQKSLATVLHPPYTPKPSK